LKVDLDLCHLSVLYNQNIRKNFNQRFKRKYNTRKPNKFIYIFTEGKETEVKYFKSKKEEVETKIRRRNIKIKGIGDNALNIVEYALDFIKKEDIELDIDEFWVVFDKDDYEKQFDNAINRAKANKLKVAYSNECFELWFLLHFNLLTSPINRKDYFKKLDKEIKKINRRGYNKNLKNVFSLIKNKEKEAIKNAKKLINIHKNEKSFLRKNPSTTVHLLIESLNKLKE
jgi:hypothetical protein